MTAGSIYVIAMVATFHFMLDPFFECAPEVELSFPRAACLLTRMVVWRADHFFHSARQISLGVCLRRPAQHGFPGTSSHQPCAGGAAGPFRLSAFKGCRGGCR